MCIFAAAAVVVVVIAVHIIVAARLPHTWMSNRNNTTINGATTKGTLQSALVE